MGTRLAERQEVVIEFSSASWAADGSISRPAKLGGRWCLGIER